MNTNNTPAPEHGEPWDYSHNMIFDRDGDCLAECDTPFRSSTQTAKRACDCVNALAGISDPAAHMAAMREAMNAAAAKLRYIVNEADALWDIRDESRSALTKLQPFLDQ